MVYINSAKFARLTAREHRNLFPDRSKNRLSVDRNTSVHLVVNGHLCRIDLLHDE